MMLQNRTNKTWQRWGASSAALFMLGALSYPVTLAQAAVEPTHTLKVCGTETVLLPEHPHVKGLQRLFKRYMNRSLPNTELGLSRLEFAAALAQLQEAVADPSPSRPTAIALQPTDRAFLDELAKLYRTELAALRDRQKTGMQDAEYARPYPTGLGNSIPRTLGKIAPNRSLQQVQPRNQALPPQPILSSPAPVSETSVFRDRDRIHPPGTFNTEDYSRIQENPFQVPTQTPLSTFSVDVDTASYSNARRLIRQGQLPPKDAVRVEEFINYFDYDYPQPTGDRPFSVTTEVASAPWNPQHQLVHIGLKGRELQTQQPSNLVFLIDVSGSMQSANKLALVKRSLCLLTRQLRPEDRVSLVVYAGNAGVVLPPTPGNQQDKIMQAIDRLEAGGSTAGSAGIQLAYQMAQRGFLPEGNNRVILATDGDFNVGASSDAELERLIEQKRESNIFLSVLGFGTGNYKDNKMELLANKGNGNYAYIDTLREAQKALVHDMRSTLFTIAKDVKIQVEFNPAKVQAYRLIGYENRLLRDQDFNDDRKDAGEIGSGHTVTALYEIIPVGVNSTVKLPTVDPLKYQPSKDTQTSQTDELMQVKLRYKQPTGSTSQLITQTIGDRTQSITSASENLRFSAAVAMFGMVLRASEYRGNATYDQVLTLAQRAQGGDRQGYRSSFIDLVQQAKTLAQTAARAE